MPGSSKVLADQISGLTRTEVHDGAEGVETPFSKAGKAFRQANGGFQGELARVAREVGQGADGTALDLAPLQDRYKAFLAAMNGLQQVSAADLEKRLQAMVTEIQDTHVGVAKPGLVSSSFLHLQFAWHFSKSILYCIHALNSGNSEACGFRRSGNRSAFFLRHTEISDIARAVGYYRDRTIELTRERQQLEGQGRRRTSGTRRQSYRRISVPHDGSSRGSR